MTLYNVTARQYGNSVKFEVEAIGTEDAEELKNAMAEAKQKAAVIFDYKGTGDEPKVSVSQVKEQAVGSE